MKRIVLLTGLLIFCLTANSQYTINHDVVLGEYVDGTPAKATVINMNNKFASMKLFKHCLMLSESKDNRITNYVLDKSDLHEITQIKGDGNIFVGKNGYFNNKSYKRSTFYNFQGKKLYEIPIRFFSYNDSLDIVAGYNHPDEYYKGEMSAYRISTGKLIWKQVLPHRYHWPWCDAIRQENIIYMITDSLVRLDITTGKTIKMPFTAGVDEPLSSILSFVKDRDIYRSDWEEAGLSLYPYIANRVLSGTHSNSIISGDSIFIADAKNFYCLDKQLNKIWTTPLPADAGAKSEIEFCGEQILFQNFGVAFQKGLIQHCGKPFVAVYDRHTGKELSVTIPQIKNKLTDGLAVKGRAYWIDDRGLMYNNQGETEIHRIKWTAPIKKAKNKDEEDECFYWQVDTVYQYANGRMEAITTDAHQVLVEANQQDVYLLKDDGTQQKFSADSIYFKRKKNIYFNNGERYTTNLVTDDSKKVLLICKFKGDLHREGNRIYAEMSNGIGFIDLK